MTTGTVLRWYFVIHCVHMQLGGRTDRQLADPLNLGLSTASGASKLLQPVSELEPDVDGEGVTKVSLYSKSQRWFCLEDTLSLAI